MYEFSELNLISKKEEGITGPIEFGEGFLGICNGSWDLYWQEGRNSKQEKQYNQKCDGRNISSLCSSTRNAL